MGTKKSKRTEEDAAMAAAAPSAMDEAGGAGSETKKKKEKKAKKEKKSKRKRDDDDDDAAAEEGAATSNNEPTAAASSSEKADRKAARAAKKAAKRDAKAHLLSQLPQTDADGIPFNKIQIRRMLRRVKHGLPPLATEEEEREMQARERRERIEEERLYAAEADAAGGGDDGEDEDGSSDHDDKDDGMEGEDRENEHHEMTEQAHDDADNDDEHQPARKRINPPSKKTKRAKPVPPDYTCLACHNQCDDFVPHWIYDCPHKQTKRGCNQIAKKLRGLHDPPSRKVFVSGLPFECDEGLVKRFFEEGMLEKNSGGNGGVLGEEYDMVHCKLLKFDDSNRCKGQGFLTFASDDAAQLALKLNGSVWREVEEPGTKSKPKKKAKGNAGEKERKELRLKVTKMQNRRATHQKQHRAGPSHKAALKRIGKKAE